MQLVAYGAQDIYLSGNPQITFFKVVYRRHTNFSIESIEQTFNGSTGFDRKVTSTISRNGDLINQMYLDIELPAINSFSREVQARDDNGKLMHEEVATDGEGVPIEDENGHVVYDDQSPPVLTTETTHYQYVDWVGHALIKSIEIEIGGQRIDKHYGDWLHIWNELSQMESRWNGYKTMINGSTISNVDKKIEAAQDSDSESSSRRSLYIPLQFWFCRNPGVALPLIALQYHEVKVNIEFAGLSDLIKNYNSSVTTQGNMKASLFADYIYLDTDERRRFAQVSHEYLIEQLQFTGDENASRNIKLNFNHPVKELIWVEKDLTSEFGKYQSTYSSAQLTLNSHDRFSKRNSQYFQLVQPYQHHQRVPALGSGINVYSFALKPEEHNPSGSCNMSRIDDTTLKLDNIVENGNSVVKVYAVNYNVLRVMSGMAGVAYSN